MRAEIGQLGFGVVGLVSSATGLVSPSLMALAETAGIGFVSRRIWD